MTQHESLPFKAAGVILKKGDILADTTALKAVRKLFSFEVMYYEKALDFH